MSAAVSSGVEQTPASWSHARNRRARRKAALANHTVEFPTTFAGWARSTRAMRAAFAEHFGMIAPELLTAREASEIIEKKRIDARDRGLEFELHISLEDLAREHEARERTTPWLAEPVIWPLVQRLSRGELGYCNATEYSLRLMAWVDTGHVYGEQTIGRRLRVAHAAGEIERERIPRGGRFRNGEQTGGGTTTNRFWSDKERRQRSGKATFAKRKQRARAAKQIERVTPATTPARARAADETHTALPQVLCDFVLPKNLFRPPPAEPIGVPATDDMETRRALATQAAIQAAAHWTPAERGDKPPG